MAEAVAGVGDVARERVVPDPAAELVVARPALHRVVAVAAADAVVAGARVNRVVATERPHAVVAAERLDDVGLRRPPEPVGPVISVDRRRHRCRGERPGRRERRD
jgi:hypothetical protein